MKYKRTNKILIIEKINKSRREYLNNVKSVKFHLKSIRELLEECKGYL